MGAATERNYKSSAASSFGLVWFTDNIQMDLKHQHTCTCVCWVQNVLKKQERSRYGRKFGLTKSTMTTSTGELNELPLPGDRPGDLAECIPPLWLSLGGSNSRVIRGLGAYSFLGLLDTSFILDKSQMWFYIYISIF